MKIAVLGAGAIGSLVAGYLKLKGADVTLVARPEAVPVINKNGLMISGARGDLKVEITAREDLPENPDLIILATKTQDISPALKANLQGIYGALILTTQNGLRSDYITSGFAPKENIISSIVMFGATYSEPGEVVHNFEGAWIIGKVFGKNDERVVRLSSVLNKAFPVIISDDLIGMKYLKVFVNANNCIAAILGVSMQEAFSDIKISRISMAIWREGLNIVNKAGIKLTSLPDFNLERLDKLTAMPIDDAAGIFSGIMKGLSDRPLYGSILQSIKRGKSSEIDYINGEFVALAEQNKTDAPLNRKLVEMVHAVEKDGKFFNKEELLNATEGLVSIWSS